jgi:hypothetical protein
MANQVVFRSWADWEEDEQESTMCLFDTQVLISPKEALDHMKTAHGFDLSQLRKSKSSIRNAYSTKLY